MTVHSSKEGRTAQTAPLPRQRPVANRFSRILATVSLAAVSTALCLPHTARAQNTDPLSGGDDTLIIVTGARGIGESAAEAKENAPNILDAVGPEILEMVPDMDLTEAAMRIPGVSAGQDLELSSGAVIRGFNSASNLTTLDGVPLATTSASNRGDPLKVLPSSLPVRLEAIKTVTAGYDPHALGGQINIVTKSAFSYNDKSFIQLQGFGGINTESGTFVLNRQASVRAGLTAGHRFGQDERFGIMVNAEYQRVPSTTGGSSFDGWTYYTAANATTPYPQLADPGTGPVNTNQQDYAYDAVRTRIGGGLKLDYRGDQLSVSAFGGFYSYKDWNQRSQTQFTNSGNPTKRGETSFTFPYANIYQGVGRVEKSYYQKVGILSAHYEVNPRLSVKLTGSYSAMLNPQKSYYNSWILRGANNARPMGSPTTTLEPDGSQSISFPNPEVANDLSKYVVNYVQPVHLQRTESDLAYGKAELEYVIGEGDRTLTFNLGGNIQRSGISFDQTYDRYNAKNNDAIAAIGGAGSFVYPNVYPVSYSSGYNRFVINPDLVNDFYYKNTDLFTEVVNNTDWQGDFKESEVITAGYLQANAKIGRLTILAGMRYDHTDVDVTVNAPGLPGSGEIYRPIDRKGQYDYWLPSALVTYNFSSRLRLRAGISKTIGRPSYSVYASTTTFNTGLDADGEGVLTINQGNENILPLETTNYDLSLELYSPTWGAISVAGFWKDLTNITQTARVIGDPTEYNGVLYDTVYINQPINAQNGRVRGVELSWTSRDFTFLPGVLKGLGMYANFTLLDGYQNLPMVAAAVALGEPAIRRTFGLVGQPEYIANVGLSYRNGPFKGLVTVNRTGKALTSVSATEMTQDVYYQTRNRLDLKLQYNVWRGASLTLQGSNLTNAPAVLRTGPGERLLKNTYKAGTTFLAGVSVKF